MDETPHLVLSPEGEEKLKAANAVLERLITLEELEKGVGANAEEAYLYDRVSWESENVDRYPSHYLDRYLICGHVNKIHVERSYFTEESWFNFLTYYLSPAKKCELDLRRNRR